MPHQQISRKDALLIVCKALNPFVDAKLLTGGKPVAKAEDIEIKKTLKTLLAHDQQNNEHSIDFILNKIAFDVQDAGFDLTLGKGQLVNDFDTIGNLVTHIVNNADPA
jgi:hypothetical protein